MFKNVFIKHEQVKESPHFIEVLDIINNYYKMFGDRFKHLLKTISNRFKNYRFKDFWKTISNTVSNVIF